MLTLHPPPHCLPSPSPTAHLRYSPHIPGAAVTMATASLSASGTRDWHAGISSTPIYLILPGPKSVVWEDLSPETQSLYFKPRVPYMGKLRVVLFLSFYWNLCCFLFYRLGYLSYLRAISRVFASCARGILGSFSQPVYRWEKKSEYLLLDSF